MTYGATPVYIVPPPAPDTHPGSCLLVTVGIAAAWGIGTFGLGISYVNLAKDCLFAESYFNTPSGQQCPPWPSNLNNYNVTGSSDALKAFTVIAFAVTIVSAIALVYARKSDFAADSPKKKYFWIIANGIGLVSSIIGAGCLVASKIYFSQFNNVQILPEKDRQLACSNAETIYNECAKRFV